MFTSSSFIPTKHHVAAALVIPSHISRKMLSMLLSVSIYHTGSRVSSVLCPSFSVPDRLAGAPKPKEIGWKTYTWRSTVEGMFVWYPLEGLINCDVLKMLAYWFLQTVGNILFPLSNQLYTIFLYDRRASEASRLTHTFQLTDENQFHFLQNARSSHKTISYRTENPGRPMAEAEKECYQFILCSSLNTTRKQNATGAITFHHHTHQMKVTGVFTGDVPFLTS